MRGFLASEQRSALSDGSVMKHLQIAGRKSLPHGLADGICRICGSLLCPIFAALARMIGKRADSEITKELVAWKKYLVGQGYTVRPINSMLDSVSSLLDFSSINTTFENIGWWCICAAVFASLYWQLHFPLFPPRST